MEEGYPGGRGALLRVKVGARVRTKRVCAARGSVGGGGNRVCAKVVHVSLPRVSVSHSACYVFFPAGRAPECSMQFEVLFAVLFCPHFSSSAGASSISDSSILIGFREPFILPLCRHGASQGALNNEESAHVLYHCSISCTTMFRRIGAAVLCEQQTWPDTQVSWFRCRSTQVASATFSNASVTACSYTSG